MNSKTLSHPVRHRPERSIREHSRQGRIHWSLEFHSALLGLVLILASAGVVAWHHFTDDLPSLDALTAEYDPPSLTLIHAADGRAIDVMASEYRVVVPLSRIPDQVILAFVAAEDARFFEHPGVDLAGTVRAFLRNQEAGRIVQGGSTITQQVVRSFILSQERSYRRKIREAVLAYRIEHHLSKEDILRLYLNQIYLGSGAYGVEAAARAVFGKHVEDLGLAEAAALAGLANAPGRFSPFSRPRQVKERQAHVLGRMVAAGFIDRVQEASALAAHLEYRRFEEVSPGDRCPYFSGQVRRLLAGRLDASVLARGGLRVWTSVDPVMQKAADDAVRAGVERVAARHGFDAPIRRLSEKEAAAFLARRSIRAGSLAPGRRAVVLVTETDGKNPVVRATTGREDGVITGAGLEWAGGAKALRRLRVGDLISVRAVDVDRDGLWMFHVERNQKVQGALACLAVDSGRVTALVGGRDFDESQFNRATQAVRQTGSAFKPVLYAAAMENGFAPNTVIADEPVEFPDRDGMWRPMNADGVFMGDTTLYWALVQSRNVVAVRLLTMVGFAPVLEMARKMGLGDLHPHLSLALGSGVQSPLNMASAFTAFPGGGLRSSPFFIERIEDADGRVLERFEPLQNRVMSRESAFLILDMMRGVVREGTGRAAAALSMPVGGKTGTTNDYADAWFVGCTPDYSTAVWVGHDRHEPIGRGESGGRAAAPILADFLSVALKDRPVRDFAVPPDIVFAEMDAYSGLPVNAFTARPVTASFRKWKMEPGLRVLSSDEYALRPEDFGLVKHVIFTMRDGKIYKKVEWVRVNAPSAPSSERKEGMSRDMPVDPLRPADDGQSPVVGSDGERVLPGQPAE